MFKTVQKINMALKKLKIDNPSERKFLNLEKASEYEEVDFSLFTNLEELWINSKTEYYIPENITQLPKLRKFILNTNCRLPKNFGEIKTLEELWLNGEVIYYVPDSIKDISSIKKLVISFYDKELTPRVAPSWIFKLKGLEKLSFTVCKFSMINIESTDLQELTELDFGCSLSDLTVFPNLSGLKKLKKLIAAKESVQGQKTPSYDLFGPILESIKDLNQLEELNISDWKPRKKSDRLVIENGKVSMPDIFDRHPNLVKLSIARMKIDFIPESILNLKHLRELNIQGNNFSEEEKERIVSHLPQCF